MRRLGDPRSRSSSPAPTATIKSCLSRRLTRLLIQPPEPHEHAEAAPSGYAWIAATAPSRSPVAEDGSSRYCRFRRPCRRTRAATSASVTARYEAAAVGTNAPRFRLLRDARNRQRHERRVRCPVRSCPIDLSAAGRDIAGDVVGDRECPPSARRRQRCCSPPLGRLLPANGCCHREGASCDRRLTRQSIGTSRLCLQTSSSRHSHRAWSRTAMRPHPE
jgi:hypothetical protein